MSKSSIEARRARILGKINKKYDGEIAEDTQPLISSEKTPETIKNEIIPNDQPKNDESTNLQKESELESKKIPEPHEKSESAFDEYKKLKNFEKFQVLSTDHRFTSRKNINI